MQTTLTEVEAGAARSSALRVAVVIPAYRARATIERVVREAAAYADVVVVVDDCCPERTFEAVPPGPGVDVIRHARNRGVGGAVKSGIARALELGADVAIKLDADGQMDCAFIPALLAVLERHPRIDLVKGNRFADAATVRRMPALRLIGNAGLSLLVKVASGYWTISDPSNGFLALRAEAAGRIALERLAERYFFEIDLLCALGTARRPIAEFEMPAIYAGERSSLSIGRALFSFPPKLLARVMRRLVVNYVLMEMNIGTVCAATGIPLLLAGLVFGGYQWALSISTNVTRPTGTIILALLLFMTGFQLVLQAIFYDVQFAPKTLRARRAPVRASPENRNAEALVVLEEAR